MMAGRVKRKNTLSGGLVRRRFLVCLRGCATRQTKIRLGETIRKYRKAAGLSQETGGKGGSCIIIMLGQLERGETSLTRGRLG